MGDLFYKTLPSQRDLGKKNRRARAERESAASWNSIKLQCITGYGGWTNSDGEIASVITLETGFFLCVSSRSGIKSACSSEGEDKEERGQRT